MKKTGMKPIRTQIFSVNLIVVAITILLTLFGTLCLTLRQNQHVLDRNLMNSAQVIARIPIVLRDLEAGKPTDELYEFLKTSTVQISDIDIIAVADINNIQYYYPDRDLIGRFYMGKVQQRILDGEPAFTSHDTGRSGAERCAYAPVKGTNGELLGFVMVGIYMRSVTQGVLYTIISFILIAIAAVAIGAILSFKLSDRIKRSLMGYEPEAFLGLFHQREDILEALEEGILAIDGNANLMYINKAATRMLEVRKEDILGKALQDIYPDSTLDRVLSSKRSEHNIPLLFLDQKHILSDRMPIWEDGRIVGAVVILRNRTEVTRLAKDLTGVLHMVDALRAYTHEFMNKLHVILGLLQLGQTERAEAYIMDVTSIQRKAVGEIMNSIEDPSVAALLVGKTSRCAEMGIRLSLGAGSRLQADEMILPTDACVTILGNLIENAIDAMNLSVPSLKEIIVSLNEDEESLLICVEDTGPGIEPEIVENIFRRGFSTKSIERGTGLSLVSAVVTAYHGQVRVESELGVGTTFLLTFRRTVRKGSTNV
ncbi:MAG: diguanylate cyclase [Evtepia sp.]|nr:diguanylate cyclase [Evtepia sp.]